MSKQFEHFVCVGISVVRNGPRACAIFVCLPKGAACHLIFLGTNCSIQSNISAGIIARFSQILVVFADSLGSLVMNINYPS